MVVDLHQLSPGFDSAGVTDRLMTWDHIHTPTTTTTNNNNDNNNIAASVKSSFIF